MMRKPPQRDWASITASKGTDQNAIIDAGALMTPAMMVEGEIRSSGTILSTEKIKQIPSPRGRTKVYAWPCKVS